jgi:TonB family protein
VSPELVLYTLPTYPDEALLRRIEGTVVLRAVVAGNGTVKSVTPVSGNLILARSAESAVRSWVYRTQSVNGKPAEASTNIVIDFLLPKKRNLSSQSAYQKSLPE